MWASIRAAVALVLVLGAATPSAAEMVALQGQVTYRERVALPPGASLRIMLVDLTETGNPAVVDVRAPIGSPGQVPLSFALNFDAQALVAGHQHGIIAEILAGENTWFETAEALAIDPLAPPPALVVVTSPAQAMSTGSTATPSGGPAAPAEIVGVTWRASEIRGAATAGDVDSTLLIGADKRAGGRGGCNSYFTQVEIAGMSIGFGEIAATRMACVSDAANAQESTFFAALSSARTWRLDEDGALTFIDAADKVVVRFAAVSR